MKPLVALLLALLSFASASAEQVGNMPAPAAYVDDYAGVMSATGKAQVEAICHDLHARTGAQIFVVTIHSLEDSTIEQFSNDLFHNWKIGQAKTDRGVLLLFAINDHKRRIEVGYGLEAILPDGKVGDIGRDMVPELRQADYDGAILTGVNEVEGVIAADANVTLSVTPPPVALPHPANAPESGSSMLPVFFIILALVVIFLLNLRRRRSRGFGPGVFPHNAYNDTSMPMFMAPPIDTSSSTGSSDFGSSSSSDSGSGSIDSSSSSDTFSGGGGGDSGGGGASGDW